VARARRLGSWLIRLMINYYSYWGSVDIVLRPVKGSRRANHHAELRRVTKMNRAL
jgi:hypothetical protein